MTSKKVPSVMFVVLLAFAFLLGGCASLGKEKPITAIAANANKPEASDGGNSVANIYAIDSTIEEQEELWKKDLERYPLDWYIREYYNSDAYKKSPGRIYNNEDMRNDFYQMYDPKLPDSKVPPINFNNLR